MANPKRASMREGPLAALFRKTEEAEEGQQDRPEAPAAQKPAAREPAPAPPHPRETGLPHPALSESAPAAETDVRVPTPQERLRHAFSSEIPDNVMDRHAPPSAPVREPEPAYERR